MSFDPVAWINTPRWQTSRLGLERVADLLERMGRPQDGLRFVHVAGTNGKGSVCAYLASVLEAAGYRVGLFTSPYILHFEERIRVNGANITVEELARAVAVVRPVAEAMEAATGDHPTEFELMAAVALEHFRAAACDIVVLEVGLGGRLDATNVIDRPEASIITRIGLDHTDLLGDTLAAVAGEKAGIVKAGVPVVSWPQEPEAMAVIEAVCAERGCELRCPDFADLAVGPLAGAVGWGSGTSGDVLDEAGASAPPVPPRRRFTYRGCPFETHLLGSYQPFNAALALAACEELRERGWTIPEEACRAGIAAARWPGRFEVVDTFPLAIVDGGHNPQGAEALASSLADLLGEAGRSSVHFALGVLADKDYPAMVRAVAPWAASFSVYAPENPRALAAHELAACARDVLDEEVRSGAAAPRGGAVPVNMCASPAAAFAAARDAAGSEGVAVAFGTLYAIADLTNASGCR